MWFSWWRRNRERDLDRELRAHLDLEAEELGDRYAAQRALGNTASIKEATREVWGWSSIDILLQDLRYGLRGMRRSPALTAVAVLSLALGIGANTAIFSLIYSVMLKSLPVSHPEELLQVTKAGHRDSFSNPVWEQIRDRQDVFSGVFAYYVQTFRSLVRRRSPLRSGKSRERAVFRDARSAQRCWAGLSRPRTTSEAAPASPCWATAFGKGHTVAVPISWAQPSRSIAIPSPSSESRSPGSSGWMSALPPTSWFLSVRNRFSVARIH